LTAACGARVKKKWLGCCMHFFSRQAVRHVGTLLHVGLVVVAPRSTQGVGCVSPVAPHEPQSTAKRRRMLRFEQAVGLAQQMPAHGTRNWASATPSATPSVPLPATPAFQASTASATTPNSRAIYDAVTRAPHCTTSRHALERKCSRRRALTTGQDFFLKHPQHALVWLLCS
jgi:hypothetical protein